MMSAAFPGSSEPISFDNPSNLAACVVAVCKAPIGIKPAFTIAANSLGKKSGSSSSPNAIFRVVLYCALKSIGLILQDEA